MENKMKESIMRIIDSIPENQVYKFPYSTLYENMKQAWKDGYNNGKEDILDTFKPNLPIDPPHRCMNHKCKVPNLFIEMSKGDDGNMDYITELVVDAIFKIQEESLKWIDISEFDYKACNQLVLIRSDSGTRLCRYNDRIYAFVEIGRAHV